MSVAPRPFFVFHGEAGDLVKVFYADGEEEIGILIERSEPHPQWYWMVAIGSLRQRLHSDGLKVINQISP